MRMEKRLIPKKKPAASKSRKSGVRRPMTSPFLDFFSMTLPQFPSYFVECIYSDDSDEKMFLSKNFFGKRVQEAFSHA